jgi:phospholipid transport system substrate-binding protein
MRLVRLAMNRWTKLVLLTGTASLMMAGSPSLAAPTTEATEAVQSTIANVMRVLDDEKLKNPEQTEERRHEIEEIIRQRVDYEEMAKRALGTQWSSLSHYERHEFVDLFVQLLRDAFAGRISEHSDEQVHFLDEHREDSFAEVKTQLKGRKIDTHIDFRLMHRSGDWRVYDVVIDGASIVSNYRSQFTSIIRDVSYGGLVKKMRQKAIAVKVFEKIPGP